MLEQLESAYMTANASNIKKLLLKNPHPFFKTVIITVMYRRLATQTMMTMMTMMRD
jgi:hypothetical protein